MLRTSAACLAGLLLLFGCSSGSEGPGAPDALEPGSFDDSAVGSPCDVIASQDLSQWAERDTQVVGPEEDDGSGATRCTAEIEEGSPEPFLVRWSFEEALAPVQDLAEDEAEIVADAQIESIELDGGFPAALVEGDLLEDWPTVQLVTVLDGQQLLVVVSDLIDPDTELMRSIVTSIGQAYADEADVAGAPSERAPTATAPCDVISDEALSSWTQTPQVVTGGGDQRCGTIVEAGDGLIAEWTVEEADDGYRQLVEDANFGEEGKPVEIRLAGDIRAAVLETDSLGEDLVRVVTLVGEQVIEVEVQEFSFRSDPVPPGRLRSVAEKIANAYAEAG